MTGNKGSVPEREPEKRLTAFKEGSNARKGRAFSMIHDLKCATIDDLYGVHDQESQNGLSMAYIESVIGT
jgi:hypothetical protein